MYQIVNCWILFSVLQVYLRSLDNSRVLIATPRNDNLYFHNNSKVTINLNANQCVDFNV